MDDKDLRQTVSASSKGMYNYNQCTLGTETGPQTIIVRQVIAESEEQKVLDIHVVVPDQKPSIEQIVDVFVKNVEINYVDVITDKVIVRGEFEVKAIYVADLPNHPVHAVEIRHYRWTQDLAMSGVRKGMDADASVVVEFVDYDMDEWTRAYKHKHWEHDCDDTEDTCDTDDTPDTCDTEDTEDTCDTDDNDTCDTDDTCDTHDHHHHHDGHCGHHHHHHNCREFDVSVVLKITAKVMTDREVQLGVATMPTSPKG